MDCPSCHRANRPDARFCDGCGTALARPADVVTARKIVTIVFADLVGSTSLHERLDAESARRLMDRYYAALRDVIDAHGGALVKLLGDGVMAAFGVRRVGEDDAIRAVRAAVAMQAATRGLTEDQEQALALRVGVNTGEVVVSDDQTDVVGDPVNVAARLQEAAGRGDVLIGEATQRLVAETVTLAPFGTLALKGRTEGVDAFLVVSLDRPAESGATPFVGRSDELRRLLALHEASRAAAGPRLAVVLGSPGLGKSRLLAELARRLTGRARVLTARCDAGGAPFAPIVEALRPALGSDDANALVAGTPAPEETFALVRRLLATLAHERPVVLALDDVQWADPLLLDLAEHLVQWSAGTPLVLVLAARPELRELRPSLATSGALVHDVVMLGGLDAAAAARLAASVVGADALPAAVAGRVLATSEGNPLYVRELVRMLVHDGVLRRESDGWAVGVAVADLEMPPTIHALLAARIERLGPAERLVLERAAVVGRQFSRGAVANLLPPDARAELDQRLESLRRSELVEADPAGYAGEPALRFHHALIRDAAYRRILKGTRAELHHRLADWLDERGAEGDETIGWHLEQAHQHLRELGQLDVAGRTLGERAAHRLATAGRRALERDELARAAALLGRALDVLPADDPARADLVLDRCEALLAVGDVGPAAAAVGELGRLTGGSERLHAWHTCFAGQLAVLIEPEALRSTADAVARAADALAALEDAAGEAKAHAVHATALVRLGAIGACEAALDRALAAARRAHDRRRAHAVLAGAPPAALWGPSPVPRASGRCLDVIRVLRIAQAAPAVEAVALRCQAVLEALRGRSAAARRMIASSRRMVEELGVTQGVLETDLFAGLIELFEGEPAAAEASLRRAYDGLRAQGLGIDAAQAAALLGRALLSLDCAGEAEALSHESEALAGDDLKAAIAWRGVRAEALARRGEHRAAIELARAAVELAAATDALLDHADARVALATALRAAGRADDAAIEQRRAVELWEAKGATLLAPDGAEPTPSDVAQHARRRVRPNAATASAAAFDAAVAARDEEAIVAQVSDDAEVVHHPTGTAYGRVGVLKSARMLLSGRKVTHRLEPLATLGERLALFRRTMTASDVDALDAATGAMILETVALIEVDAAGRRRRAELFASDRLADAVARLYAFHAESTHTDRERAAGVARTTELLVQPPNIGRYRQAAAPDIAFHDHRSLGLLGTGRGAESFLRGLETLLAVSAETSIRTDDVVALQPDAVLMRWTNFGIERASGGAYERRLLLLWVFDTAGRLARFEQFDADRDDDALARFDELTRAAQAAPFTNAVCRAQKSFQGAWSARDWNAVVAAYTPDCRMDDRRALVGVSVAGADFLRNVRFLFDLRGSTWRSEPMATRGERLALFTVRFSGEADAGAPIVAEHLSILEHDDTGRVAAVFAFDPSDLDGAYQTLDARYDAGEAATAPHAQMTRDFRRAFAARDWDALAARLAPDLVVHDHRVLGWETLRGPSAYLDALRALVDLAPDVRLRIDHFEMTGRGAIYVPVWCGTHDGGGFETPSVIVAELDDRGRIRRFDQYDLERVAEARARFAEIDAGA